MNNGIAARAVVVLCAAASILVATQGCTTQGNGIGPGTTPFSSTGKNAPLGTLWVTINGAVWYPESTMVDEYPSHAGLGDSALVISAWDYGVRLEMTFLNTTVASERTYVAGRDFGAVLEINGDTLALTPANASTKSGGMYIDRITSSALSSSSFNMNFPPTSSPYYTLSAGTFNLGITTHP